LKPMSPRERVITAMRNQMPDRVPVAPDISNMIPARMTGKPFWDIYIHDDPPLWRAYITAIERLGIDGWFIYGDMRFRYPGESAERIQAMVETVERKVVTWAGVRGSIDYTYEQTYYLADPPTRTRKAVADLERDWKLAKAFLAEPVGWDSSVLEVQRRALGDKGALGVHQSYPGLQCWPYVWLDGGIQKGVEWYYDRHDLIMEVRELHERQCLKEMEMVLDAKPDFVIFGGSGTITLQSPAIARELCLPTLKKLTRMAKQAGMTNMLHSCGKERDLVKMCVEETDLGCINPLEVPPQGDCDLAELKRAFGAKIALMGNLHTTEVMLKGTRQTVLDASRKAIEDAGANGGFILSTGDQCGRDTPDENVRAMVEAAERWGRY
jgi:uroporphyrinogen decarboxylase